MRRSTAPWIPGPAIPRKVSLNDLMLPCISGPLRSSRAGPRAVETAAADLLDSSAKVGSSRFTAVSPLSMMSKIEL
jgi:hypothetical protein